MIARVALALLVGLLAGTAQPAIAAGEDVSVQPLARDGQVVVSFDLPDGLSAEMREAIHSGLPTVFTYEVALKRDVPGWLDRTLAELTVSATVRYDNLTRRYQLSRSVDGRIEEARPTEDEAAVQRWLTHFERVPLATTATLEPNIEYYVRVRVQTRPRMAWFFWPWGRSAAMGLAKFTLIP